MRPVRNSLPLIVTDLSLITNIVLWENNLCINPAKYGFKVSTFVGLKIEINHNVILGTIRGGYFSSNPNIGYFRFKNNVLGAMGNSSVGPQVWYLEQAFPIAAEVTHNLYYCPTAPSALGNSLFTAQPSDITGQDPKLVNIATYPYDFHLTSSSPCIGMGTSVSTALLDFGGSAWKNPPSIGAFEYDAVSSLPPSPRTSSQAIAPSPTPSFLPSPSTVPPMTSSPSPVSPSSSVPSQILSSLTFPSPSMPFAPSSRSSMASPTQVSNSLQIHPTSLMPLSLLAFVVV